MTGPGLTLEAAFALGLEHLEGRRPDQASEVFAAILAAVPGHAQAAYLLGLSRLHAGRAAEALPHLVTAVIREPTDWRIRLALAGTLDGLGRLVEAAGVLRAAIAISPAVAQVQAALAPILDRLRDPVSTRLTRRALAGGLRLDDAAACFNLARTLIAGGAPAPAARLLRQGLALQPSMPELVNALSVIAFEALRLSAESIARRALALAPLRPDYRYNLAGCHALRGDTDGAAAAFRQVLALAPDHAPALNNLGLVLKDQSLVERALAAHHRALAIEPANADFHRNRLAALLYIDVDEAQRFALHRAFGRAIAPAFPAPAPTRTPKQRLTLAYLSSDFRDHPVGRSLEPVIAAHDRSRFRLGLYVQHHHPDETTRRFVSSADYARDVSQLDDEAAARLMRDDGVDILVVLAGRYDRNRPGVAAHRAAPVQVSLHDPATSGIEAMDYLIADPVLAPRGGGERFVERVVRLPRFVVQAPLSAVPPTRVSGPGPVFGCCNAPAKLSHETLALWARLLARLPESRLVLKSKNLFASRVLSERVRAFFAAQGIGAEQLELRAAVEPLDRHLANYADVDIALDPFPFNGSTASFEALWMGVPVVTRRGTRMAGRWTTSMLEAIDLADLVAAGEDAYVAIAAGLAADRARLQALRGSLRPRLQASPLMDGRRRARQLERLYRAMWERRV
jgi:predicted O-linked N-acetylglucosamine transferase (SPINDLY family)